MTFTFKEHGEGEGRAKPNRLKHLRRHQKPKKVSS